MDTNEASTETSGDVIDAAAEKTALTEPAEDQTSETARTETAQTETGQAQNKQTPDTKADGEGGEAAPALSDFTMPAGFQADDKKLSDFKSFAQDNGLNQAQAQAIVDYYAESQKADAEKVQAATEATQRDYETLHSEWETQRLADKEIGGDHAKAAIQNGARAIKAYGTPELIDALNLTGAGNHPEIVRFFARVGATVGEDQMITGGTAQSNMTTEERWFGKSGT